MSVKRILSYPSSFVLLPRLVALTVLSYPWLTVVVMLLCIISPVPAAGLGVTVPPTLISNRNKFSSLDNLQNCVSYQTVKDDIILVRIRAGDRILSQLLNLNIFDLENNKIRFKKNIAHDLRIMFTNLNSAYSVDDGHAIESPLRKREDVSKKEDAKRDEKGQQLLDSNTGKLLIYICFDNVYTDRSWSFRPRDHEVELQVEIKNLESLQQINYNNYAHYFNKVYRLQEDEKVDEVPIDGHTDFTEDKLEENLKYLQTELNNIISSLEGSESILRTLMENEFKLRDTNEEIYVNYSKSAIVLFLTTGFFGIAQVIYLTCYLKKHRIV